MDWFAQQLLAWHRDHGRKDLPWQKDITPYRVWVSEIMLQQTQVTTVIGYFERFMRRFPDVGALAAADLDEVLHLWTGLGYYARARNLHKTAQRVAQDRDGTFPHAQAELEALPGIGRSTAGAIRAIAMGQQASILDGNVKRVLARFHAVAGYPGVTAVANTLWSHADTHTPAKETAIYTQAIMDLGATVCLRSRPACDQCPVGSRCAAREAGDPEAYPGRKPKRDKPVREARFFVVTAAAAVLLERRPLDGLWGGLWTPPERPVDTPHDAFMRQELGAAPGILARHHVAPRFRHTFTHFHLDIEPVYLVLAEPPHVGDSDDRQWFDIKSLAGSNRPIGLSVPAVKLLASLKGIEL